MKHVSRAQFLRGDWRGQHPDLRPPWALAEPGFSDTCDGCGKCVTACGEKIIFMSFRKLPLLDFTTGGCTFCGDCAAVCDRGALQPTHDASRPPWSLRAEISVACLAKHGTTCVVCLEACDVTAIVAKPALGGRTELHIDAMVCTGCGMCIATCPTSAISLSNTVQQRQWGQNRLERVYD